MRLVKSVGTGLTVEELKSNILETYKIYLSNVKPRQGNLGFAKGMLTREAKFGPKKMSQDATDKAKAEGRMPEDS